MIQLSVSTEKPIYGTRWEDRILIDTRIWTFWNEFFVALGIAGLCVKTHYYVSSHGGKIRDLHYVISPDILPFLNQNCGTSDFTENNKQTLSLYPVLTMAQRILGINNILEAKVRFNSMLIDHPVNVERLAEIINCMSKEKITTEYRGVACIPA